jgi:hypothetical protein
MTVDQLGALPPIPRDLPLFPRQNGMFPVVLLRATSAVALMPFRPLNRSLRLLPSIALSCPAQVPSVCATWFHAAIKKQRTASVPFPSCLTLGVHPMPRPDSSGRLLPDPGNQGGTESLDAGLVFYIRQIVGVGPPCHRYSK